ncbi:MAG: hypothetical protein ACLP4V_18325 [Methylocella sp.]
MRQLPRGSGGGLAARRSRRAEETAPSAADGVGIDDILESSAVDLLASRLRTPLQIEQHLIRFPAN